MHRLCFALAAGIALFAMALAEKGLAQQASTSGPYRVLRTAKVGGTGGFDYIFADSDGRKLYIPRRSSPPHVTVFNLDTLEPAGEIPNASAAGVTVSSKSGHGFATSRPIAMWDTKTLMPIKTIDVMGGPDGSLYDPFNDRVYILSHSAPNATVLNAADGSILGTIDLGGAPEQAATDGKGRIYVDIEDKGNIAVVDAKTMLVTTHYDLMGKGGTCAGLALDVKNNILFAACRSPRTMVILSATDGKILETLPIGQGTDGAAFNPNTMEAFSSQGDGTLTVIKENSPTSHNGADTPLHISHNGADTPLHISHNGADTPLHISHNGADTPLHISFAVEQNVKTMTGAKTMTLDTKTNRIFLMSQEFAAPPAVPDPPPAAAPGGRGGFGRGGGRGTPIPDSFTIIEVGK